MKNAVLEKAIPSPTGGESEDDFIGRCMSSDQMQSEFPDQDQRSAVCFDEWRKKSASEHEEDYKEKKEDEDKPCKGRKIKINYHPYDFENKGHIIEKADG